MKPDWKDAPEWATHLAMDSSGRWYWYDAEPREDEREEYWVGQRLSRWEDAGKSPSWKDSLESRPAALDLSGSPDNRRLTETCRRCGGLGHAKFGSQEE